MVSSTNASTPALNETSTQAADRISAWMRNVERVVDDARMNFGSSPSPPLVENEAPPLSPPPGRLSSSQTRSHRSARLPRRVLAANQIFADGAEKSLSPNSSYVTSGYTSPAPSSTGPSSPGLDVPVIYTPSKQRQEASSSSDLQPSALGTPLRRREKSRSHADLLGMEINPMGTVDLDSRSKISSPRPSPPLDRKMFITTPRQSRESIRSSTPINKSFDELTSSPLQVEPYPQRIPSATEVLPDTPNQRRLEGVYDRFLMATSGVKRLGKGYQSDNLGPVYNTVHGNGIAHQKPAPKFTSIRRSHMPPAVSSEDVNTQRASMSVDELGMMTYSGPATSTSTTLKDEGNATVARMRRAIKAIVPGKAVVSRRVSRVY
ncbi:hypothetical protein CPB85DRAFT_940938 [Mucidula mucida]|nr:hypothetical protein CPB85DRAFT_940938 [Mucidula mucida]